MWYGMRYWKAQGAVRLDFGGGGSCRYKSKYGGDLISVPWVRKSRFRALEIPRSAMKAIARARQYAQARMKSGKNEECEVE